MDSRKKVDEDWKRRAQEEKSRLQPQPAGPSSPGQPDAGEAAKSGGEAARTLPAFLEFLSELATQALIHLGEVPHPATRRRHPNLDQAQYTLEVLSALQKKTEGNLSAEEKRLLDGMLYELKMKYVQAVRREASPDRAGEPVSDAGL